MTETIQDNNEWIESTTIDDNLCRICLSISDLLVPIFEGEGVEQKLYEKIKKYLPVKISPSDTLPQQICYLCAGTLVAWNSLYTTCINTDKKLQSLLSAEKSAEFTNKEVDSDDEPLRPPKKIKLSNSVNKEEIEIENLQLKVEKPKKKINVPKKINKSVGRMSNKDEEGSNGEGSGCQLSDFSGKGSSKNENVLTTIKTECNSEDEAVTNEELKNGKEIPNDGLIKCEFCQKSYKDKKCLSRHMKKCHEDKSLKAQRCDACGNIYKTRANLQKHYLKEHLTDQVQCPVCHASFNSKKLDFHLKSVHGVKTETENEEKFKCKLCDKWFKNKYVRNSHVKETHLSEPMKCKLCDFEGVRTVLRRHKRDVHAEKRFLCSLCPGAFKTLHTLKMHMISHSDIRCYTCDICGMRFKRLSNVRDHMKCHEQKRNQCQICGNFFARKRYLAIHEKTIHNFYADGIIPEDKGFECGTCGAKLKWKKNLLAHMRIHTGEKPYVCKI